MAGARSARRLIRGESMDRTKELDQLMRTHNLTARQAGALIGRDAKTVRNWRSSADRTIPEHALQLLRAKLAARAGIEAAA